MGCCSSQEQQGSLTPTSQPQKNRVKQRGGKGGVDVMVPVKPLLVHQTACSEPVLFSPTTTEGSLVSPPSGWQGWHPAFAQKYDIQHLLDDSRHYRVWKACLAYQDTGSPVCGTTSPNGLGSSFTLGSARKPPVSYHTESRKRRRSAACRVLHRRDATPAQWRAANREADILQTLNHPNVLAFRDSFVSTENSLLVTELCKGGEVLHNTDHQQIYTEGAVMRIMGNVLCGLAHVHDRGVCHRNLHPGQLHIKSKLKPHELSLFEKVKQRLEEHLLSPVSTQGDEGSSNNNNPAPAFVAITSCRKEVDHKASLVSSLSSLREVDIAEALQSDKLVSHISSSIAVAGFDMAVRLPEGDTSCCVEDLMANEQFAAPEVIALMARNAGAGDSRDTRCGAAALSPQQEAAVGLGSGGGCDAQQQQQQAKQPAAAPAAVKRFSGMSLKDKYLRKGHHTAAPTTPVAGAAVPAAGAPPTGNDCGGSSSSSSSSSSATSSTCCSSQLLEQLTSNAFDLPYDTYDQRCDIWSVGVIAYVLLTGEHPAAACEGSTLPTQSSATSSSARSLEKMVHKTLKEDPAFDNLSWATLSDAARDFVSACLQRDYRKRPTAAQLMRHRWFSLGSESPMHACDDHGEVTGGLTRRASSCTTIGRLRKMLSSPAQGCCDIVWDHDTLQTSKEVLMTIESSLDPRDPRDAPLSERLLTDLQEHHPGCVWLVYDDSGGCVKDYINELEQFQSHHVRLSIGTTGFLVIGVPGNKEKHAEHDVVGAQVLEPDLEIIETTLPQSLLNGFQKNAIETGGLGCIWLADFLSVSVPDQKWVVILGTTSGGSMITTAKCPVLKTRYKQKVAHCYGFAKSFRIHPMSMQKYPPE